MKIVVLDGFTLNPGDLGWEGLNNLGELVYDRHLLKRSMRSTGLKLSDE